MNAFISRIQLAIVHGGKNAHRDEFMFLAILAGLLGPVFKICRRDPTEEEMESDSVMVADVGGKLDAEKLQFDHHQDRGLDCAFVLFLKALSMYETARACWPWLDSVNVLDTKGPMALAKHYGMADAGRIYEAIDPVGEGMLEWFASTYGETPKEVDPILVHIGQTLLQEYSAFGPRWAALNTLQTSVIGGVYGIIIPNEFVDPTLGLTPLAKAKNLGWSITKDDRGPGLTLFRFNDHPRINFALCEGDPEVAFAHKGGFIIKTKSTNPEAAFRLVQHAIS